MPDPKPDPDSGGQNYGRPLSIEELSNRYAVHPASSVVEKFAIKWGISANIVSFLGLGAGWLAALFYYYQDHRIFVVAGFVCMFLWHVFDGADGRVARATGTSSAFGRVIDGMCDHLVFGAVYIAFVLYLLGTGSGNSIWLIALIAAVSHAVQAAGYEERRQKYQRRIKGVGRAEVSSHLTEGKSTSSGLAKIYDWAQRLVSGGNSPLDNVIHQNRNGGVAEEITQALIGRTGIIVRAWALLNANNRTIMIAVMAFLGKPELYFIYEIIVLNILMVLLVFFERMVEATLTAKAAPGPRPAS